MRGSSLLAAFVVAVGAVSAAAAPAAAQDAAAIKKGQELYAAQKCSVCHSIGGQGNKNNPLDGVGKKLNAADTKQWIVDPVGMTKKVASTKKPPMPARWAKLPAADLDALVAYMQSLK